LSPDVAQVFRAEYGRAVAVLARFLGDISLAEEAVQDAFTTALERWPREGAPPAPAGWIITTARNRAIDRLRREASRDARQQAAMHLLELDEPLEEHDVKDDQLRLIFTCCHPALAPEAQLALTLRLIGGLTTAEIARAFLVPEVTMGQRISRAKAKIRAAGIPYRVPETAELPARRAFVLAVIYLIFNEGYSASAGETLTRAELCEEAIRLGRLLNDLGPGEPETSGLLALMLFIDARRDSRVDEHGAFVRLAEQDRSRWNTARLEEARALMRACLAHNQPGPFQIQAAINAVHSDALDSASTDWGQILALYDQLMALAPSPVIALNRAVAVAELRGPAAALVLVDELALSHYHLFHAVRADLLRRLGRSDEAAQAYRAALGICGNTREREFLEERLTTLRAG
jgi:RNA polymerase sigma-70 factor (ECF subfamily)